MGYYVYMLRCEDSSIYTGIAIDYLERYKKHLEGKGAKYTKLHKPVRIESVLKCNNRSEASKIEIFLKSQTKKNKEKILNGESDIEKIILESIKIKILKIF